MASKSENGGPPSKPRSGDELLWLETYFILFPSKRRPTLTQVERAITQADPRLKLENLAADDDGFFESVLVESPEDNAAVEISYETGEAVIEQNLQWAKQLKKQLSPKQLQHIVAADARLDVAHFERVEAGGARKASELGDAVPPGGDAYGDEYADEEFDEEAAMEIFDPTCLLTVVDALAALTKGLTIDPAAGELV
jgi:hypothetical protein